MSTDAPQKKSKMLPIVLAAVLVLGGGGAGAWWFLQGGGDKGHGEAGTTRKKSGGKPVFVNLDPFTVNLRDERGERYAQIGITFEVEDASIEVAIKDRLPSVRNNILLLISAKSIEDLLSAQGKQQLAQEVRTGAASALGFTPPAGSAAAAASQPVGAGVPVDGHPIRTVLFSQFIVQ